MTDDAPHICPDCHREFQTRSALISHTKTHRAAPEPGEIPHFDSIPEAEILGAATPQFYESVPTSTAPVMPDPNTTHTIGHVPVTILPEGITMDDFLSTKPAPLPAPEPEPVQPDVAADVVVRLKKLRHYGDLPEIKRATIGSAGIDLAAANYDDIVIGINQWHLIPTGLCIEVPLGWVAKIAPRSGLAANDGITILNTPGIVDSDYRGEIKINLVNNTTKKFVVKRGMRIAQMLIERSPVVRLEWVDELTETTRGAGGFGSTGR